MKAATVTLILLVAGTPVLAGLGFTLAEVNDPWSWQTLLQYPGLTRSLEVSVWSGSAGVLLALFVAHLIVAVAATSGRTEGIRIATLPFIALPHLAVGIGLALLLGPSGLVLRLLSPWATGLQRPPDWLWIHDPLGLCLVLGLVVKETPFLTLMLLSAAAQVPTQRILLQCRSLGYSPLKAWLVGVAPLLQRQIRLPLAAAWVFGMSNVEMAIPLGPSMPPPLAVVLWQWFTSSRLELRGTAFAGSALLLLVSCIVLAAASATWSLVRFGHRAYATSGQRGFPKPLVQGGWVCLGTLATLGGGALLALVLRAVSPMWRFPAVLPTHFKVQELIGMAPVTQRALTSTISLGAITAALAVAIALIVAKLLDAHPVWRRRVGAIFFTPLLLPQLVFLFGFQWLLGRLHLDGTRLAVIWEHTTFALPYAWAILAPASSALDPRLVTVGRSLGAGEMRTWLTVTLPLLLRSIVVASAIAFAVSSALYLPTLFAGAGRVITLATEAAGAAASGNMRIAGINGAAQALAPLTVLALATLVSRSVYRNRKDMPR